MATMTKEECQARAYLVRIHEANCKIEHPTADELNFRLAIMKQLGNEMSLGAMRSMVITGPVPSAAQTALAAKTGTPAPAGKR